MEKELIRKRIEIYKKEMEEIRNEIPTTYDNEKFVELNKRYERHIAVVEELEYILNELEKEDVVEDMKQPIRTYETYIKLENGKYYFTGWYPMMNEEFCIETKVRGKYIYKKYKWLTGKVEEYKYGSYVEE